MSETPDRYDRQKRLWGKKQELLRNATVLIAGVGATGSFAAVDLALAGVGNLILIDFDTVEVSNLNRQLLFLEKDIGRPKVYAAAEKLKKLNPDISIETFFGRIEDAPLEYYEKSNVILSGLDNYDGRIWLNNIAVNYRKVLVDGGMDGLFGYIQVIIPGKTACLLCYPLIPVNIPIPKPCSPAGRERMSYFQLKAKDIFGKLTPPQPQEPSPAVSTMATIIGGLMANETLRVLLNIGNIKSGILFIYAHSLDFVWIDLNRRPDCPVCGIIDKIQEFELPIEPEITIKELKKILCEKFSIRDIEVIYGTHILNDSRKLDDLINKEIGVISKDLRFPIYIKLIKKG